MSEVVVDASIAKSAGGLLGRPPVSFHCASILDQILRADIIVVFTLELSEEWQRRASHYSADWLFEIVNRGRYRNVTNYILGDLRTLIDSLLQNDRIPLLKDVHLIEAALKQSCGIVSSDGKARHKFSKISDRYPAICTIMWVDPTTDFALCQEWLQKGTPVTAAFFL